MPNRRAIKMGGTSIHSHKSLIKALGINDSLMIFWLDLNKEIESTTAKIKSLEESGVSDLEYPICSIAQRAIVAGKISERDLFKKTVLDD